MIAGHPTALAFTAWPPIHRLPRCWPSAWCFGPVMRVMMDAAAAEELRRQLPADCGTEVLQGEAGLSRIAAATEVDTVMAAIVGAAGLPSALAAARAGKTLLLANKESLVMGGHLLMQAVQQSGARLLPIDSEHNAIFQCMPVNPASAAPSLAGWTKVLPDGVRRAISPVEPRPHGRGDTRRGLRPSQLVDGPQDIGRLGQPDEQGLELIEACWILTWRPGR